MIPSTVSLSLEKEYLNNALTWRFNYVKVSLPLAKEHFEKAFLLRITVPSTVAAIGQLAFHECKVLTKNQLCSGLQPIKKGTFSDCESLSCITIRLLLVIVLVDP